MHGARGGFLIGYDVLFAHGTRKARRGHGKGLSCANYLVDRGLPYCCVAHAKGVDTTAVCPAAYRVERVTTTTHVLFRSCCFFSFAPALLCYDFTIYFLG